MGGNYPGAGITLGPALTFGYIAGKHIAGAAAPQKCPELERTSSDSIESNRTGDRSMRAYHLSAALAVLAFTPALASAGDTEWRRYVIPSTGTSVDMPVSIFTSDAGAPEGGTGRRFFTEDRRADLTVQSVPNPENDSPATFLAKKRPPAGITYKRITSDFFVVSSIRKDRIWYNRCNRGNGTMNCVLINYPAAEKRQWDSVVTRISHTLRS